MPQRVVFLIPPPIYGSGGHKTILRHAQHMSKLAEYRVCLLVVPPDGEVSRTSEFYRQQLIDFFSIYELEILDNEKTINSNDLVIATAWWTVYFAGKINAPVIYFVQDLENLFNPAGTTSVMATYTYSLGLNTITIGDWLRNQLSSLGSKTRSTPFGIDKGIYFFPEDNQKRIPRSILILDQPEKPRRCHEFVLNVIEILREIDPNLKIATYGSEFRKIPGVDNLGLVAESKLGALYRSYEVGIALSATNPSRVPFEMSASGLMVFDFDIPSTGQDYKGLNIRRVVPSPQIFAEQILQNLHNESVNQNTSINVSHLEEWKAFADAVERFLAEPVHVEIPHCSLTYRLHASKLHRRQKIKRFIPNHVVIKIRKLIHDYI